MVHLYCALLSYHRDFHRDKVCLWNKNIMGQDVLWGAWLGWYSPFSLGTRSSINPEIVSCPYIISVLAITSHVISFLT